MGAGSVGNRGGEGILWRHKAGKGIPREAVNLHWECSEGEREGGICGDFGGFVLQREFDSGASGSNYLGDARKVFDERRQSDGERGGELRGGRGQGERWESGYGGNFEGNASDLWGQIVGFETWEWWG